MAHKKVKNPRLRSSNYTPQNNSQAFQNLNFGKFVKFQREKVLPANFTSIHLHLSEL